LADESSAVTTAAPPQATHAATPGVRATAASLEPSLPAWGALHLALESRAPLVRSPEYIERSDRVFAATPLSVVPGRPDFYDRSFGITLLKRFPPYVYSLLGGMLVHKIQRVEAHWYTPKGSYLVRERSPRLTIHTVCGQTFYGGVGRGKRARACATPRPESVPCGRCAGTGPVFGRGLAEKSVTRASARLRVGCTVEVP
jgi:hypothetical protein